MTSAAQRDAVVWRDLLELSPLEKAWELSLGLPWLASSLWCYGHGWWGAELACSFYVFLTCQPAVSQVANLQMAKDPTEMARADWQSATQQAGSLRYASWAVNQTEASAV